MRITLAIAVMTTAAARAQTTTHSFTRGLDTFAVLPHAGPGLASPLPLPAVPTDGAWQQSTVPPGVFIRAISMASAQMGFAAAELGIVLRTTDGGQTWQTVLNEGFPAYYYGVHAFSEQTVVVSGFNNSANTGILRWSGDGGQTWDPVVTLAPAAPINWLAFNNFNPADPARGVIQAFIGVHYTTTGGRTAADWHFVRPGDNWFQGPFTFLPDNRVWMTGYDNFRSTDGGATWQPIADANPLFDGASDILPSGLGFIGGGTISPAVSGWVYSTVNGGDSWSPQPVLQTPYPARAVLRLDESRAWTVGGNYFSSVGGIWGTTDGGANWSLEQDTGNEMLDIQWVRVDQEFIDVYAAGQVSQVWKLRVAHPAPGCYPDCNADGALNLADFGCFTTRFALGEPYGDCNGDGVRNLSDFGCFTTKFALGCP